MKLFKENHKRKSLILFLIFIGLTLIPYLFWGHQYFASGDDSKLYYMFPYEYFINFTSKIISDNSLGSLGRYISQSYISTFALLLVAVKKIFFFLNTQLLMFGLNISFAFLGFFSLLSLWIEDDNYGFVIKILTSLLYTFSIFNYFTLWTNQLFSLFLISVIPWTVYLFAKSIKKHNVSYLIGAVLILSLFSIVVLSLPWFLPSLLPFVWFFISLYKNNKRTFIEYSILFLLMFLTLNIHWIFPAAYSPFSNDQIKNDRWSQITSTSFTSGAHHIILSVSKDNNLIYPLLGLFHKNIQINFKWHTYNLFSRWYLKFSFINDIILVIIIGSTLLVRSKKDKNIYSFLVKGWLVSMFFFTVKIGGFGQSMFLWLVDHIPLFVMFRNMYDKFGIAMAISSALVIGFSLKVILKTNIKTIYKNIIISIFTIFVVINAIPFINGNLFKVSIKGTHLQKRITNFNKDFYHLVSYIKQTTDPSRYLWLPMNVSNYVFIKDSASPNYYIGVSPLQFLTDRNDFTSIVSFGVEYRTYIYSLLVEKKYKEFLNFLRTRNVKYLIVNNDMPKELQNSSFFTVKEKGDLYNIQNSSFYKALLGKKIKDFGGRYSLFMINDQFLNEKIYLTNNLEKIPSSFNRVDYKKITSYKYEITIHNLNKPVYLVFLDPYHKQWTLYIKNSQKMLANDSHYLVFDYANGWKLDPEKIKREFGKKYFLERSDGSIDLNLILYFKPQKYFFITVVISLISFITIIGYYIFYLLKR